MFHVEHPTFSTMTFFVCFLLPSRLHKKEARLRAFPPAVGRFCGIIPFRRMAIPAERFLCHRTHFPMA